MNNLKKILNIIIIINVCFFSMTNFLLVKAETTNGSITGNDVRLRTGAGTNNGVIIYLYKGYKVVVNDTSRVDGVGCPAGWYNITYNGKTGYVCGEFLDIDDVDKVYSYNRPWTSPKRAIYGGAEFIADGYISSGQNTSYLKKFNVNPNAYYNMYTNQYMANLAAPYNEALSTYYSYRDNGLLNLPLHFEIPIFENMPEHTSHPVTGVESGGLSIVEDLAFEQELNAQGFPETYKTWLRALHKEHSNWTFSSFCTGEDFSTAVAHEKWASSVSGSCTKCKDPINHMTESGWYIANDETVEYFLDPRNFLGVDSILMFEDLGFNEHYTEKTVQSVLENTFMSGTDNIDKEKYSKMFMDAGKAFDVNPIYLASLAKQESGTKSRLTTDGREFSYQGSTYFGIYNFFNIGAYSSEENPAKAGLVYASAGAKVNNEGKYVGNIGGNVSVKTSSSSSSYNNKPVCKATSGGTNNNQSSTPQTQPQTSNNNTQNKKTTDEQLKTLGLNKKGNYITNFKVGVTASSLLSKDKDITITSSGKKITGGERLGTGDMIKFANNEEYSVVIYGDLTGDGVINSGDLLKMRQQLLGTVKLSGAYLEAAHLKTLTGNINSGDLLKMRQHLLGTSIISQE